MRVVVAMVQLRPGKGQASANVQAGVQVRAWANKA